jgi:hypothetical protein
MDVTCFIFTADLIVTPSDEIDYEKYSFFGVIPNCRSKITVEKSTATDELLAQTKNPKH